MSVPLEQLVSEMLTKVADERPATCQAVIARLHGGAVELLNRPVDEAQSPPLSAIASTTATTATPSPSATVAGTAPSRASSSTGPTQEPTSVPAEVTLSQALAGLRCR